MNFNLQHKNFIIRSLYSILVCTIASYLFYAIYRAGYKDLIMENQLLQPKYHFTFIQLTIAGVYFGFGFNILEWILSMYDSKWYSLINILLFRSTFNFLVLGTATVFFFLSSEILFFGRLPENTKKLFADAAHSHKTIVICVYGYLVSFIITFLNNIILINYGSGLLHKLITGNNKQPKEENRIFMFLDLKSSTATAEKLGHLRYSQFIQDCFNDLTHVIIHYKAEIYQYVGDEVVLTWNLNDGIDNLNCIKAFYSFNQIIETKKTKYLQKYDIMPEFKAGANAGKVSVAEVGKIKRDIAYHGDVINTAARIQEKCNDYKERILISEILAKYFEDNPEITTQFLGNVLLKGKKRSVNIYSTKLNLDLNDLLPNSIRQELLMPLKDGFEWARKHFIRDND